MKKLTSPLLSFLQYLLLPHGNIGVVYDYSFPTYPQAPSRPINTFGINESLKKPWLFSEPLSI
jgi:hypothetical protein